MVDRNGATYCGIKEMFAVEWVASKGVSCQIHLKNYVN